MFRWVETYTKFRSFDNYQIKITGRSRNFEYRCGNSS